MSIWETYPAGYRSDEIKQILVSIKTGECVSIVGLSGAGKSNLMGFFSHLTIDGLALLFIDCNDLAAEDSSSLLTAMAHALDDSQTAPPTIQTISVMIEKGLKNKPKGICFLFDRFDLFQLDSPAGRNVSNNLRALRDRFKYDLTYVISTRRPLDPSGELSELFFANTLWLGQLNETDALWSAAQYAKRHKLNWDEAVLVKIIEISRGYPSMLRAVCEAHASGVPLGLEEMQKAAAVLRRVKEFWDDQPGEEAVIRSGLENHPLLMAARQRKINAGELTAAEQRLMEYLTSHTDQVCTKEELISAVWPEEKLVSGLRDDSLTQLVHRLREKVDPAGTNMIQTLPGRGYRYNQLK